jgi:hypothetical protein
MHQRDESEDRRDGCKQDQMRAYEGERQREQDRQHDEGNDGRAADLPMTI